MWVFVYVACWWMLPALAAVSGMQCRQYLKTVAGALRCRISGLTTLDLVCCCTPTACSTNVGQGPAQAPNGFTDLLPAGLALLGSVSAVNGTPEGQYCFHYDVTYLHMHVEDWLKLVSTPLYCRALSTI